MKIADLGEGRLIERIARPCRDTRVVVGIGDDCAVLKYNKTHYELLTTDSLVEGDHFRKEWFTPFQVGRKAVIANVSDIIAMGGTPAHMLISLCLPETTPVAWVDEFYRGAYTISSQHTINIVGGNMTHGTHIIITITLVGHVQKKKMRLRSMAKVGDLIGVTGVLGGSAAGLAILKANIPGYVEPYCEPLGDFSIAQKIVPYVHAMIDVSDGLASEVTHICNASGVGAVLYKEKIPLADTTRENARNLKKDPVDFALYGGEDYQMVFTAPTINKQKLKQCFIVGEIVDKNKGISLMEHNQQSALGLGFEHFKNTQ